MDFIKHLERYLTKEEITKLLDSLKMEDKHAVLLNINKMDEKTFLSIYPNCLPHPIVKNAFLYDKNEYDLGKSIYYALGCFYLQEPSAMLPSYLLDVKENDLILDMCAAPGGKSVQASLRMNDKGLIISNDLSRSRSETIIENVERMGLGNIVIINNDFSKIYKNYPSTFDKIILDAPCSGSGMFRKEKKMEEDWSYAKVLKFSSIQKELLLMAYYMLKPGGIISYSTCSFSYEEDEEVVSYLLANSDAEIIDINHPLFYKNKNNPLGVHIFPFLFNGEGHYICLIKKPGTLSKKENKVSEKQKYGFNYVYRFGDYLFGLNEDFNFKGLNIVRLGVKIGEMMKNKEIKYDLHYAHQVKHFDQELEISKEQLLTYLSGNVLDIKKDKGLYLLKFNNINVDISNSDGRVIKNHYPKGLRRNFK